MGEQEKKEKEEKPKEEEKPKKGDEEKPKEDKAPPPPPEEVVMRVYMHCEGCARKVKKILKRFHGVEDVIADSKAHKVVVKGKKAASDPMKVVECVKKKTGRKVELLWPIPPPVEEKKEEEKKEEPEPPKPEEKKGPPVITVVLKVHMHCDACALVIKKRILKMKGVQSAEPDLKASEVAVKGVFDEAKLAEYVHKRTGKLVAIVKSELVATPEKAGDGDGKDVKKDDKEETEDGKDDSGNNKKEEKEKADGCNGGEENDQDSENDHAAITAANLYMHYPQFAFPGGYYLPPAPGYIYPPLGPIYSYAPPPPSAYPAAYAPHIFSDENPHACSVM